MEESVITLAAVGKNFGKRCVLKDISLKAAKGAVFGLVGLNGAGKTTLFRVLLGLLKPTVGEVRLLGQKPSLPLPDFFRNVGIVLEHNGFWGNLTVLENLKFFSKAKGISREQLETYLSDEWKHTSIFENGRKAKYLSRGEKMQGALCRAFLGFPQVLILDEPAVALDVRAYDHFCGLVRTAQERGSTILISSHQLDAIDELCDSVGVIEDTRLTFLRSAKNEGTQSWILKTSAGDAIGSTIEHVTSFTPTYANSVWRFQFAPDTGKSISDLIAELVKTGVAIEEIYQEKTSLKQSLRDHLETIERRGIS